MNIEEKILKYLHEFFPDIRIFTNSTIPFEDLGLDPQKDALEFEKVFDHLRDKNYIERDGIQLSITFQGISYYEEKYLKPNYYFLKAIKIILEFLEKLENGEYADNSIPNSEIIDELEKEEISMNNKEFYQFLVTLYHRANFFKNIGPFGIQTQDKIKPYIKNKPLLTPNGRKFLDLLRHESKHFVKITDPSQKSILLEEYDELQKEIQRGSWKDACIKMGGILEYLLTIWLQKKGLTPYQISSSKKVKNFTVNVPKIEISDMNSLEEYFFKFNIETCREIYGVWDEEKNDFVLLGYSPLDFLDDIETLIFNCATTTLSLAENTFGREFDAIIKDKEVMKNPIYVLDDVMTMTKTKETIPLLVDILDLCNIPKDETTVIYSKKKFETEIHQLLPEVHTGHYGDCRGSNRFEECKNVVLFGRFALRDSVKWLLSLYGLNSKEIKSMEQAEEIQALHRVRPLLDNEVKIFLFTNTLIDKIPDATEIFNKRHLDKCLEILSRKEELEGLSKTDLYDKLKGDHNDIKRSLEILEHFNKIKPIFGYGVKLTLV